MGVASTRDQLHRVYKTSLPQTRHGGTGATTSSRSIETLPRCNSFCKRRLRKECGQVFNVGILCEKISPKSVWSRHDKLSAGGFCGSSSAGPGVLPCRHQKWGHSHQASSMQLSTAPAGFGQDVFLFVTCNVVPDLGT